MSGRFDIAVFGAGPSGSALALSLVRRNRSVLLVDSRQPCRNAHGELLAPAARPILCALGLLDSVNGSHATSYGLTSYWGSEEPGYTEFLLDPNGAGWLLDRSTFDVMLRDAAVRAGAVFEQTTGVGRVSRTGGGFDIRLGTRSLSCNWIVDATGRSSVIARSLGAARTRLDRLVAFSDIMKASPDDALDRRVTIESVSQGWWYSMISPRGGRFVSFLTDPDVASGRCLRADGFIKAIAATKHLKTFVSLDPLTHPCGSGDASTSWLVPAAGNRWVAVGDAVMSFDPLSGTGVFNALYSAVLAAHAVDEALDGDFRPIENYKNTLVTLRDAFQLRRARFYAAEQRWREQPFWARRQKRADRTSTSGVTNQVSRSLSLGASEGEVQTLIERADNWTTRGAIRASRECAAKCAGTSARKYVCEL